MVSKLGLGKTMYSGPIPADNGETIRVFLNKSESYEEDTGPVYWWSVEQDWKFLNPPFGAWIYGMSYVVPARILK